jgi:hypothetical protein
MTFDQFRLRLIYDLGRFKNADEALLHKEYDEWLKRFALFAVRGWVTPKYDDRGLEERNDLRP